MAYDHHITERSLFDLVTCYQPVFFCTPIILVHIESNVGTKNHREHFS